MADNKQVAHLQGKAPELLQKLKSEFNKYKINQAPRRTAILLGDWSDEQILKLTESAQDITFDAVRQIQMLTDEELDKRLGIPKLLFRDSGYKLVFSFNLTYRSDWTHLELKEQSDTKTELEIAEIFRTSIKDSIYELIGITDIQSVISHLAYKYPFKTWGHPPKFKNFDTNYDT